MVLVSYQPYGYHRTVKTNSLRFCTCSRPTTPPRVVYGNSADNSHHPKPGTMLPTQPVFGGGKAMVSHLFSYQLAVLVLAWLFVMLHVTGAKPSLAAPPMPARPKRKRSTEPKALAGLTPRPHCALCERATLHPTPLLRFPRIPGPQRTDAPGRWTPRGSFVPTPIVTIAGGWG